MAPFSTFPLIIILLLNLTQVLAGQIIYEEGYAVSTLIDGNKLQINPYSALSLYGSSSDVIILDSVKSTFYTVSVSNSLENEIQKLSGNGDAGYSDGDLGSAMFNKPKSFALDSKNNIYVADKAIHVIRKIGKSGVTTIAGGYTHKAGNVDGPAQNASFSDDFELAFAPQRCALLISDHGNRLIRQIYLKAEDCVASSSSKSGLGSTTAWALGMAVACLIGLMIGFAIRPYVLPHGGLGPHLLIKTWKQRLTRLAKQTPTTFCFDIKNAIAKLLRQFVTLSFSQLSLVYGLNLLKSHTTPPPTNYVSLLDCDNLGNNNETTKSDAFIDELSDLLTLDVTPRPLLRQENAYEVEKNRVFLETERRVDRLMYANVLGFVEGCERSSSKECPVIRKI